MSDHTEVATETLRGVAHDITIGAGSAFQVAEALRNLPAPDSHAFGNSSAGQDAHNDYQKIHQNLIAQASDISDRLQFIGTAVRHAAEFFDAAQASALKSYRQLS
ncbi:MULTISPECIES: hypothetical protein [Streptomyces]|uniref:hypothetical protein n=1 Tax=Streptomyces TaxID=1883 RepID=UPI0023DD3AD6|nr:hypothetical protein [Streptomyces sp. FXJ1.172]WEP00937.1 hypothetical protein A6P39_043045 [Streptomyces sp. FXJ1.172]